MSAATTNTPNLPAPPNNSGSKAEPFPQAVELPTLLGIGYGNYPVQQNNFLLSFVAHILLVACVLLVSQFLVTHSEETKKIVTQIFLPSDLALPPSSKKSGGGGGGGDNSKIDVTKGKPPKFKMDQIAPPQIPKIERPKLEAEQTVLVPPSIN